MRRGAWAGIAVALVFAATLVGSCGVLLESAWRAHAPVQRYDAAAAVLTGPVQVQDRVRVLGETEVQRRPLTEAGRVPRDLAGDLADVPGVDQVVADVSFPVQPTRGEPSTGHGWASAQLRPYELTSGSAPVAPRDVVLSAAMGADMGADVGEQVSLQVGGRPASYRVSGLVGPGPRAAFFTDDTAAALFAHPGEASALGVLAAPDVAPEELAARLEAAAPGLEVATDDARGDAEDRSVAVARWDLAELGGALGAVAVMTALIVVAGLLALLVRESRREIALLRAVGATPWQVRRPLLRTTTLVAVPAALLGGTASLGAGAWMHAELLRRGVLPSGFEVSSSPLPVLAALVLTWAMATVSVLIASVRISRIHPAQALGESTAEPRGVPRWRLLTGGGFALLALGSLTTSLAAGGDVALASVSGLVVALVVATALLGPVAARLGSRTLGCAARSLAPVTGELARRGSAAAALRAGSILTPVALAIALCGTQLFALATVERAAAAQAVDADLAQSALVSTGAGLPGTVADDVRRLPGVTAATPVKHTTVVMSVRQLGERALTSLAARGVGAGASRTMDAAVSAGSLDDLRGATVALSREVAGGLEVGSRTPLWLADGTKVDVEVAAIYDRGLGVGDVLLPHDLVAAHSTAPLDDLVLVAGSERGLREVAAGYAGARVVSPEQLHTESATGMRVQGFVNELVAVAILGFVLIGLATTLGLAVAARRDESRLLRLVGATRRQLLRALHLEAAVVVGTGVVIGCLIAGLTLTSFAWVMTGRPVPVVHADSAALILLGVLLTSGAAVSGAARLTRRRDARV